MIIPLLELKKLVDIKGIIHVGASFGQEAGDYEMNGIKNVVWIEPIKEDFEKLKPLEDKGHKIFNCAISNFDGEAEFFQVTNHVSSSLRAPKRHNEFNKLEIDKIPIVKVRTLDSLIGSENIDMSEFNMLNVDTQGTEDLVLEGCENNLHHFDLLYLEVNQADVYDGTKDHSVITKFLSERGFDLLERRQVNPLQFEALYKKR